MAMLPGRFDSELSQAHEEAQREKLQREKLQREKDMLLAEAFSLKQQMEVRGAACRPYLPPPQARARPGPASSYLSLQEKDMDIAGFTQKVVSLEAELQDISSQESKDEASLAKVKKQLRDLEAKVKDQEEELDEQAGTIQMLEQVLRAGPREAALSSPCGAEEDEILNPIGHPFSYSQSTEGAPDLCQPQCEDN